MTITPLPPAPNRSDPATFSDRADNFVAALPVFASEANSQAEVVNQDAENAGTSASNAATSATASANSATASQNSATSSANSATASQNSATASANSATASANSATASAASATAADTSADEAAASAASINTDSIAITGGTIDGTVIGGSTPSAGAFTSLTLDGVPVIADLASQAQAEAGTDNTKLMTPLRLRNALNATGAAPIFACRAWVNFNGTETVAIRASGNVSSITDNGVGNYTVNFTTVMPNANYCVVASAGRTDTGSVELIGQAIGGSFSTSSVQVTSIAGNRAANDCLAFHVAIFR